MRSNPCAHTPAQPACTLVQALRKGICLVLAIAIGSGAGTVAWAAPPAVQPPASTQLPTGAQVKAGTVAMTQSQTPAAAVMNINQSSAQAIVNWQTFNVGAAAQVNITQPSSSAVLLNRVLDSNPSQIFGKISANGQVFLTNPNGVYFAPGSSVDVGSFAATTHSIADADFLNGNYSFSRNGATGSILNKGSLTASLGGYIALLSPEVVNQGLVLAQLGGTVAMAAGDAYQLQISNGKLGNVLVTPSALDTLVENGNAVQAPGGLIILSAQAASSLLGGVVKNSGSISATGLESDGGVIRLTATNKIQLTSTSSISADAAPGNTGNGGRIEIISDLTNRTSTTRVDGSISAKGGEQGGDGGFIETSANRLTIASSASVTAAAFKGTAGTWLLDPYDFTVASSGGDVTGAAIQTALATTDVTIQTNAANVACTNVTCASGTSSLGDIYINDSIAWSSSKTLTLKAYNNIYVGTSTVGGSLTLTGTANLAMVACGGNATCYASAAYSGPTSGVGLVLMGMASSPTGGLLTNQNGFNGQILINSTGVTPSGSSPISINGSNYTVINTEAAFTGISGTNKYVLGSNLTFTGSYSSAPVAGDTWSSGVAFNGNLNGLGNKVSGLSINDTLTTKYDGLIGRMKKGSISNIGVSGSIATSTRVAAGGLVGGMANVDGAVSLYNSYSSVGITLTATGTSYIGGLVGQLSGATVSNVYSTGNITGSVASLTRVGGLFGMTNASNANNSIKNVFATGAVTVGGSASFIGGLIGDYGLSASSGLSPTTLENAYATGNVTAGNSSNYIGGLFGQDWGNKTNYVYYAGTVAVGSGSFKGVIAGYSSKSAAAGNYLSNSFYDSTKNTNNYGGFGGSEGPGADPTGLTTAQLTTSSNLTNFTFSSSGWGYAAVSNAPPVLCSFGGCSSYTKYVANDTYLGASGGTWSTGIWSLGYAPTSSNTGNIGSIIIPSGITIILDTANVGSLGNAISNSGVISFSGSSNLTLSGVISGAGSITQSGSSNITLSGANTYTGTTTVNGGTITAGIATVGSTGAFGNASNITVNGGTLALSTYNQTVGSVTVGTSGGSITGTGTLTASSYTFTNTGANTATISAKLAGTGVSLTQSGSGTTTLSGVNTYSGGTTISAGTLVASTSSSALGSGSVTLGGSSGSADAALQVATTGLTYSNAIVLSSGTSGTLTIGNTGTAISTTFSGGVTGNNNLVISEGATSGTITFSGSSMNNTGTITNSGSGTGTTTISAAVGSNVTGITQASSTSAFTIGGAITTAGTTFINSGTGALTITGGITGTGNVTFNNNSSGTTTVSGTSINNTGTITNSGSGTGTTTISAALGANVNGITENGTSPLTLSGSNASLTGGTTITAGTINAGSGNALGTGGVGIGSSGILNLTYNGTVTLGSTLSMMTGASMTNSTNTANLYVTGASTLNGSITTSGTQTYTGAVALGANAALTATNKNITFGSAVDSTAGSDHGLSIINGTGTTAFGAAVGANSATSALGYLCINATGCSASAAGTPAGTGTTTLAGNVTTSGTQTYGGALTLGSATGLTSTANSGNGGVTIAGAVTIAPTPGAYALTINSGTGKASIGGSVSNISTLTINSTAANSAVSGVIGGATSVAYNTAVGYAAADGAAGVLSLAGANTYTGGTTVTGGTLQAGSTTAFGGASGAITVNNGAALDLNGKTLANANPLTLNSTGVSGGGALNNSSATQGSYIGLITLGSDASIVASSGNMVISHVGTITGNTFGLTLGGTNTGSSLASMIGTTSGTLTKVGAGTWTLSGANTFTGGTTISAGTLKTGSATALGSGAVSVTALAALDLNGQTMTSTGVLTLNSTGISSGGALTNSSIAAATYAGNIALGSASSIGGSGGDITASGVLSGAFALTKTGTDTLTLSGANTYSGGTTISAGTLKTGSATALGSGAVSVTALAALDLNGQTMTSTGVLTLNSTGISSGGALTNSSITAATYAGNIALGSASSIGGSGGDITASGVLSGAFALTKTGTDTLTLSGANTYSGGTTISVGTLKAGSATAFGTDAISVASGAALDLNGQTMTSTGVLTLNSTGISSGGALTNSSITAATYAGNIALGSASSIGGSGGDITASGVLSGAFALTKTGTDTLTLSGANTYSGGTTISVGTLKAGSATAFGTDAISVASGAALDLNGQTMTSTGVLTLNSTGISSGGALTNSSITAATYAGNIALGSASSIGGSGGDITASGVLSGAFALTKTGTDTLTLSGANTYSGGTTISVGTLKAGSATAFGTDAISVASGAALDLNGQTMTSTGALTLRSTGISSGGALLNSSSTGATYAGLLTLGAASSIVGGTGTIALSNTGTISGATYGLTLGGAQGGSIDSIIGTTSGTVTKDGAGTWTLSGANAYTGATTISAGTLAITNAAGLGTTAGGTTVASGATLDLRGAAVGAEAITLSGGTLATSTGTSSLSGTVAMSADSTASVAGTQLTLSDVVSGTGFGLTKTGGGSLILSGTNTYSGGTTLSAGTLQLGAGSTTGSIVGDVTNNATLAFNRSNDLTFSGVISGTGAVTQLGAGTTTLSEANTYSGNTTISAGTVKAGSATALGSGAVSVTAPAALDLNGQTMTSTGTLTLIGMSGRGVLTNSNSTAATYAGNIAFASATTIGSTAGNITASGVISGGSILNKVGANTLILSGSNIYSGGSYINAGTVKAGSATALGSGPVSVLMGVLDLNGQTMTSTGLLSLRGTGISNSGALTNSSSTAGTYAGNIVLPSDASIGSSAGDITASGVVGGGRALTKVGTNTLSLSGTNTYTGATILRAGTLAITNNAGLGTSAGGVTVANGATLDLQGVTVGAEAITLNGGTLSASTGTSSLSGVVSLTSASSVGGAGNLTLSGAVTSNGNGLALFGTGSKTISNTSNTLSTIATDSGVGALSVVNNAALSIGQVTTGGITYNGIHSTGTVSVSTSTGDLTVSQNVVTTSNASSYATPALMLSAGSLTAAGTATGGDVVLSGSPTLSVGSGGVALIYSGYATTSNGISLVGNLSSNTSYYQEYNQSSSYAPSSGSGYYGLFREAPTIVYLLPVAGQSSTYGTAPTSLDYCYSSSAASCVNVAYTGVPSTSQSFSLANSAVTSSVSVASGVSGSVALSGPAAVASGFVATTDAGTYALTLNPSLALTGYVFSRGNAVNYTVAAKTVVISNTARTTTYDGVSSYASLANGTAFTTGSLVGSDAVGSVTQTAGSTGVAQAGSYSVTPSAAVLSTGAASNYSFSYVASTNTVDPKVVNLSIRKTYDGANNFTSANSYGTAGNYAITGMVNSEAAPTIASGSASTSSANAAAYNSWSSNALVLSNPNYTLTGGTVAATIDPKAVTVSNTASTTTYDGVSSYASLANGTAFTTGSLVGSDAVGSVTQTTGSTGVAQAGSYSVTPSAAVLSTGAAGNYSFSYVASTNTVDPKPVIISNTARTTTYDGVSSYASLANGTAFTTGSLVGSDAVGSVTQTTGSTGVAQAGSYSVTPSAAVLSTGAAGNYSFSYVASTNTVDPKAVNLSIRKTYDGATNFTSANSYGTAGNYAITGMVNSEAAPTIASGSASTSSANAATYNSWSSNALVLSNANYTLTGGTVTATIDPKAVTVSSTASTTTYDGVSSYASLANGTAFTTGSLVGSDAVGSVTQTTGSTGVAQAGSYSVTPSAAILSTGVAGNYSFSYVASTNTVDPKPVIISNTARTTTYDGVSSYASLANGTAFTTGSLVGSDAVGSVTQTAGSTGVAQAGSYSVTPSAAVLSTGAAGNYSFSYVASTNTVDPKVVNLSIRKTYDGATNFTSANSYGTSGNYTLTGMVNSEAAPTIASGSASTSSANAATYNSWSSNALVLSNANYTLAGGTVTATIDPKDVIISNTARTTTYDGVSSYASLANGTAFTTGSLVGSDAVGSVTQTTGSTGVAQAGSYSVTPSAAVLSTGAAGNYSFSYVASTNTVDPKAVNLSIRKTYDGATNFTSANSYGTAGNYAITGMVNSEAAPTIASGSASTSSANAAAYNSWSSNALVLSNPNYTLTGGTVAATIDPKAVTVSNTASTTTYDGVSSYASLANGTTFTTGSLVGSDAVGSVTQTTGSTGVAQAGSYSVTPSAAVLSTGVAGNYSFSYVASTNTVDPKPVIISNTARTTTYDGVSSYASLANGTAFTTGSLVGSDAVGSVTQTTGSTGVAQAGSYSVTPSAAVLSTGAAGNYSFSYVASTNTVDPKAVNLSIRKTYDGATNFTSANSYGTAGNYAITGMVNSEAAPTIASGSASTSSANAAAYNSWSSNALVLSNPNYTLTGGTVTATIGPKDVIISNTARTTTYDGVSSYASLANGTAFTTGSLVGSDAVGSVTQTTGSTGVAQAGSYSVTPSAAVLSTGAAGNYSFSYVASTNTVDPKVVNLSIRKTYDGATNFTSANSYGTAGNYAITGMVNSEAAPTIASGSASTSSANAAAYNSWSSNALVLSNPNYTLTGGTVAATIDPKVVTVSNTASTTTYDGVSSYASLANATAFSTGSLVGSDAVGSVTQTTGSTGVAQAGSYSVTPSAAVLSTGAAGNYSFSYVASTNTVDPKVVNLSIRKTYDGATNFTSANSYGTAGNYTITGMVNSEAAPTIASGSASTSSANAATYNSWSSNALVLSNPNYTLTGGTVAATIDPKDVIISNTARTTTYDGVSSYASLANGTAFTTGSLVGSDAVGSVTQTTGSTGVAQAGSYSVTPSAAVLSTGAAGNYSFSYVASTNTVGRAGLTLTAVTSSKNYDGTTTSTGTPVVTGLLGTDTISGVSQAFNDSAAGVNKTLAVQTDYSLSDGNSGNNYSVTLVADNTGVITLTPVVRAPVIQQTTTITTAPPPLAMASSAPAASPVAASSSGVSVSTINSPTVEIPGLVSVLVPQGTAIAGTGLVIALPETVTSPAQTNNQLVNVSLPNNQPLPAWIRYDPDTKVLVTTAVPAGAFPLSVVVTVGNQSTVIQVSESQATP